VPLSVALFFCRSLCGLEICVHITKLYLLVGGISLNSYILLIFAILSEVFGSSLLKATDGFKKLLPSLGVMLGYGLSFYALSLSLTTLPLGLAYAIWAGVGTALTALVGIIFYKESIDKQKILGFLLIIGGVILLNMGGDFE